MLDREKPDAWLLLNERFGDSTVPAVGDYSTVVWQLGAGIGETIDYTDEKGRPFKVVIAGIIRDSILQGNLMISRDNFATLFPSRTACRVILVDASDEAAGPAARILERRYAGHGLVLTPAEDRVAAFKAVERSYLAVFQVLGGLGLLLGTVGLATVVLRNVLDRRAELGMLRAVGFETKSLKKMIFLEHVIVIAWGLVGGTAAALAATAGVVGAGRGAAPYIYVAATALAVGISSLVWVVLAAAVSADDRILEALRME
jgi:ABC-type antimicrobial peptide transport system permease subunit